MRVTAGSALVYAIVGDSGGAIDVKSTRGNGGPFSIYVPMAEVTDAAPATA